MNKLESERYKELWLLHMQGYPLTPQEIQEYEVLSLKHTVSLVLKILSVNNGTSYDAERTFKAIT